MYLLGTGTLWGPLNSCRPSGPNLGGHVSQPRWQPPSRQQASPPAPAGFQIGEERQGA